MSKPKNQTVTMNPQPMKAIDQQIDACALRSRGLLHLLAAAYAKADVGILYPATHEEIEGILWLTMQTGEELTNACKAAFYERDGEIQSSTESAA